MNNTSKFIYHKWINLFCFGLFYNTVYIGRFNLNSMLNKVSQDLYFSVAQEALIYSSVFIAYAVGSFINGGLADKYGSKKTILLGAFVSISANILTALSGNWLTVLLLSLLNGYFQSMIWLGGIKMLALWWYGEGRNLGVGIANFFSGLSHVTAYIIPATLSILYPQIGWRINLIIPMGIMALLLGLYYCLAVDKPDNLNSEGRSASFSEPDIKNNGYTRLFFKSRNFYLWCSVAMLSSLCRYGLLKWIPLYFHEQYGGSILSNNFSNLILPLGMAFGTLTLTWIAGKHFRSNVGLVITISAALCATLVVIFPIMPDTQVVLTGIFCTGFFLYGINGILWLHAIEQGGASHSGTAAGILNCFAYLGAAAEAFLFPFIVNLTGATVSIFITMEILCIGMVVCGIIISEKDTIMENDIE